MKRSARDVIQQEKRFRRLEELGRRDEGQKNLVARRHPAEKHAITLAGCAKLGLRERPPGRACATPGKCGKGFQVRRCDGGGQNHRLQNIAGRSRRTRTARDAESFARKLSGVSAYTYADLP